MRLVKKHTVTDSKEQDCSSTCTHTHNAEESMWTLTNDDWVRITKHQQLPFVTGTALHNPRKKLFPTINITWTTYLHRRVQMTHTYKLHIKNEMHHKHTTVHENLTCGSGHCCCTLIWRSLCKTYVRWPSWIMTLSSEKKRVPIFFLHSSHTWILQSALTIPPKH